MSRRERAPIRISPLTPPEHVSELVDPDVETEHVHLFYEPIADPFVLVGECPTVQTPISGSADFSLFLHRIDKILLGNTELHISTVNTFILKIST
ncbi:hypothetical protein GCM10008985_30230 [Halococcus dombrowskii]|uniref:Uncharacterized protein n=1 Tax=Halococcus dombrowskii TaxID=179637 RepID=A0AAV3SK27_HALDO